MKIKQMSLELVFLFFIKEKNLDILLKESIVDIQNLSVNYNDCLYAYCPKQKRYIKWMGVCANCFEDHPNQMKFLNRGQEGKQIQGSKFYEMIDITNFLLALRNTLNSELTKFFNNCQDKFQQSTQPIKEVVDFISHKTDQIIIEQKTKHSLAMFCIKNNLHTTAESIEFMIKCGIKIQKWDGYCSKCRLNAKHQIYVKLVKKIDSDNSQGMINYDYRKLILDKELDYRLINVSQFQQQITNYLQNQVLEIMVHIRHQTISNQKQHLFTLFDGCSKNDIDINDLKEQLQKKKYLPKQKKILKKQFQGLQNNVNDLNNQVEQLYQASLYDIQINCANLSDLTTDQGWKVVKNEVYEQQKNLKCAVVSFYGLYNKGKSFLASKLSGKIIQNGYSISTIGLSALYPRDLSRENSIIFLDTAGLETPINHHKKDTIYIQISEQNQQQTEEVRQSKIYEAKLSDRLRTENLIQQFVLNQSHLILLIVDQLSKEEQKLIKRIRSKYLQSEIIIVHNFSKLTNQQDIQKYIKIDIENSFENVSQQYIKLMGDISGYIYIEERQEDQGQALNSIIHVIMAQENSEAGKHYNQFCYKYIGSEMISIKKLKKFDIINCLMAEVEKQISNIFQCETGLYNHQYTLQYNVDKNAIISNIQNAKLKQFSLDILGFLHFSDEGAIPKYNYQVINDKLILNVELYGKFEPQLEDLNENSIQKCEISGCSLLEWHGFHGNNQLILIRARYLGSKSPLLSQPTVQNDKNQRLNRFQLIVPISPMICVLELSKSIFTFQYGIGRFEFDIQKRNINKQNG